MLNKDFLFVDFFLKTSLFLLFCLIAVNFSHASEPVVMLSVNGTDNAVLTSNQQSVTLEWFVDNVSSCTITPDVGMIPISPMTGSITVIPPDNQVTEYRLTCDGIIDSVSVLPAPTITMMDIRKNTGHFITEPVFIDPVTNRLNHGLRIIWNSERADYCTQFVVTHLQSGVTGFYGQGDGTAPATMSTGAFATISNLQPNFITDNGPGTYRFYVTCVNQFSGEIDTASRDLDVVGGEMAELDVWFNEAELFFTQEPGTNYVTNADVRVYVKNASDCESRTITSPNRTYLATDNLSLYGSRATMFSQPVGSILFRRITLTEDATFSITCWQEDSSGNIIDQVTRTATLNFIPYTEADGTQHDPWSVSPEINFGIFSYESPSEQVSMLQIDPLTGYVNSYLRYTTNNVTICYSFLENLNGTLNSDLTFRLATSRNTPRAYLLAGLYQYELICGREVEFPVLCPYASILNCADDNPITSTSRQDLNVFDADNLPDPVINFLNVDRTTEIDAEVSVYEFSWESINTNYCSFSGVRSDGVELVLTSLSSVDAVSGTALQSFTSSGQTIQIAIVCGRTVDSNTVTSLVTIQLPGGSAEEIVSAEDTIIVTAGECILNGSVVSVPEGFYALSSTEISPCLRFEPSVTSRNAQLPNFSSLQAMNLSDWQFISDELHYENVPMTVQVVNNSDSGFIFSGEDINYVIEIGYNQSDINNFVSDIQIASDTYSNGINPGGSFIIDTTVTTLPVGQHVLSVANNVLVGNGVGLVTDTSYYIIDVPYPDMSMQINTDRNIIRKGSNVTVSWSVQALLQSSCTVSGLGIDPIVFLILNDDLSSLSDMANTSIEITPKHSGLIKLSCTYDTTTDARSVTAPIELLPTLIER